MTPPAHASVPPERPPDADHLNRARKWGALHTCTTLGMSAGIAALCGRRARRLREAEDTGATGGRCGVSPVR